MSRLLVRIVPAILIASLLITGCATEGGTGAGASASSSPVLRVGLTANYPPIVDKVNGELVGIEVDFANQVASDLDKRLEFVETPWGELIQALNEGRIDVIMSGMSITQARKKQVEFVKPYMRIGQMAIIRVNDIQKLASVGALLNARARVGFEEGTTGADFAKSNMPDATPVPLGSVDEGVAALRNRGIDIFIHDAPTAWRIGSDADYQDLIGLYWPLTEEYLAWAVRKSDHDLRDALDRQLIAMTEDGRLRRITNRWIKVRVEVK